MKKEVISTDSLRELAEIARGKRGKIALRKIRRVVVYGGIE